MKKFIAMLLALTMAVSLFAGCGATKAPETEAPTEAPATEAPATEAPETEAPATEAPVEEPEIEMPELTATEQLLNAIVEKNPVEFMGMAMPVDLTNTTEDGLWAIKYYTGLDNADSITEAAFFEPMMGSIAFSMVAVKVAEGQDAQAVAEAMKNGIDTRKWVCVEADDLLVAGCGDTVLLIMVNSENGMTAQSFVDAFQAVCGADLDFTI